MQFPVLFGCLQGTIFFFGQNRKTVFNFYDQHLIDAANGKPDEAVFWIRYFPGGFQGIIQQISQNRAQISTFLYWYDGETQPAPVRVRRLLWPQALCC